MTALFSLVAVAVSSSGGAMAQAGPIEVKSVLIRLVEEVDAPARATGVLASLRVREGELVQEGQELARLEDRRAMLLKDKAKRDLETASKQAANDVDVRLAKEAAVLARAELRRAEEAARKLPDSISQSELDRLKFEAQRSTLELEKAERLLEIAQLGVKVKESEYEIAADNVDRHRIVAPLSGMVVEVYRRRGEWVEPGGKVLRILRMDRMRAEGFVHVRDAPDGLHDRSVTLVVHVPGRPATRFRGKVAYVSPEIDPVNGQIRMWAEIENPDLKLRPGMRADMTIDAASAAADLDPQ